MIKANIFVRIRILDNSYTDMRCFLFFKKKFAEILLEFFYSHTDILVI